MNEAEKCLIYYILKILKVYNKVANNWMMITDPEERLIMIDYAKQGRFKTIGYIGAIVWVYI